MLRHVARQQLLWVQGMCASIIRNTGSHFTAMKEGHEGRFEAVRMGHGLYLTCDIPRNERVQVNVQILSLVSQSAGLWGAEMYSSLV